MRHILIDTDTASDDAAELKCETDIILKNTDN
ncbi:hypothetical protein SMKC056_39910 [Serratia marcescens]|nr:hypothetical protein SMKC056_39910 [Serratia marcescens]